MSKNENAMLATVVSKILLKKGSTSWYNIFLCWTLFYGKEFINGKNLKGRECGKGICQRKDGKYAARPEYSTRYWKHANIRCETNALQGDLELYGNRICWFCQTYIAMGTMLRAAVNNDIIAKHPNGWCEIYETCPCCK